ncbi:MAG: hypothetical protein WAV28_18725, partial [Sedimentisphaerales bacterium]
IFLSAHRPEKGYKMYRINEFVDGVRVNLAVATFDDLDEAEAYVKENNGQPGGHFYCIDPFDLPNNDLAYFLEKR